MVPLDTAQQNTEDIKSSTVKLSYFYHLQFISFFIIEAYSLENIKVFLTRAYPLYFINKLVLQDVF
jgi:hypothetical protein